MTAPRRRLRNGGVLAAPLVLGLLVGCAGQATPTASAPVKVTASRAHHPVEVAGIESCRDIPLARAAVAGPRLPELSLPCLTRGPAVNLADLGGKPVLLNLWATWCGPCREEMPVLQEAHREHGDVVAIVGVDTKDVTDHAASFLQAVGVTYPQLVDLDGRLLSEHLRLPGLPVTVVIDRQGRIVDRHVGALTEDSLDALIREVTDG